MTWSLVNTINSEAVTLNKAELEAPFIYFFETFLPSKGWAVTKDESGGNPQSASAEQWYGISKSFTFADGYTATRHLLHEIEYTSTDTTVYQWTGVPGAGIGTSAMSDSSWTQALRSGVNNFHFLASDESPDAWCVIANKRLIYWSHPSEGMYMTGATDIQRFYALGNMACYDSDVGLVTGLPGQTSIYFGQGNSFYKPSYFITPAFSYFLGASATQVCGQNTTPDVYSRFTNTTAANGPTGSLFPSSVLIDGDYYLDLYPSNTVSLMLKTGATDLGVLV